jgi:hypothetical protein
MKDKLEVERSRSRALVRDLDGKKAEVTDLLMAIQKNHGLMQSQVLW